jgi:hypothetical protein
MSKIVGDLSVIAEKNDLIGTPDGDCRSAWVDQKKAACLKNYGGHRRLSLRPAHKL